MLKDAAPAAIVILRYPGFTPSDGVAADALLIFPCIPGLLAFQERPAILKAWSQLSNKPDLLRRYHVSREIMARAPNNQCREIRVKLIVGRGG
jgi:hypothetical protein